MHAAKTTESLTPRLKATPGGRRRSQGPPALQSRQEKVSVGSDRAARLAALGREAARVAHEMAVPASLVSGGLDGLERHVRTLAGYAAPRPEGSSVDSRQPDPSPDDALTYAVEHAPELVEICRDGARRIADLISELREFVSGCQQPSTPEVVAASALARDAIALASGARHGRRQVAIEQDLSEEALVCGSPSALTRVLVNLLSNALDAVEHRDAPLVSIRVGLAANGSVHAPREVEVSVIDNGTGIAPSDRERIFEAFFTTKARGSGLGLGLAISLETVQAHGGTMRVADSSPSGTAIVVRLPLASPSPAQ